MLSRNVNIDVVYVLLSRSKKADGGSFFAGGERVNRRANRIIRDSYEPELGLLVRLLQEDARIHHRWLKRREGERHFLLHETARGFDGEFGVCQASRYHEHHD